MASFVKVTYVDNETVIHAANLNAIQDSTLQNETDIDALESGKVDKVAGKGLSTNDFNNDAQSKLSNLPTAAELDTALAGKVPTTRKVAGKALSADVTLNAGDVGYDGTATYANGTVGKQFDVMKGEIDDEYAKKDGSYASMTVGNAEQLVATVGVNDKVPYNFRTAGGSADIGDRLVDKIIGGTIAWHQLCIINNAYPNDSTGITVSVSDGYLNVTGTYSGENTGVTIDMYCSPGISIPANEVCLIICDGWNGTFNVGRTGFGSNNASYSMTKHTATFTGAPRITIPKNGSSVNIHCRFNTFNLTQMFGTAIANYIYSLETSTAGTGFAWFKKLFTKSFYTYNPGELMSVQAASHNTIGFNQWDGTGTDGKAMNGSGGTYDSSTSFVTDYVPVISGAVYYLNPTNWQNWVNWYDPDKNFISQTTASNGLITALSNARFARFTGKLAEKATACINLSWDGERDGEYEPYEKHSYPLDSSLTLYGIPKLDAGNELYYDGDVYESSGVVTRKYGKVTLTGQETMSMGTTSTYAFFEIDKLCPGGDIWQTTDIKSTYFLPNNNVDGHMVGLRFQLNANRKVRIVDDLNGTYTSVDSLRTFLISANTSGHPLEIVYKLVEAEEESADPFFNPQIVDDFGTEEYVDAAVTATIPTREVAIPVGHDTMYRANLRAKLEMAPDSPDGDGDYIVRQSSGQNTYVPITFPADELPAAPTTNGNYYLKCTVSSGTATFTWASAT